jgi:hypothetical protein
MAFKCFFQPNVTPAVAPVTTGKIIRFLFTIPLSFYLYTQNFVFSFLFLYLPFCSYLCAVPLRWYCHIHQYACFLFLFLIIIFGLFVLILYLCTPLDSITLIRLHVHILAWVCICTIFLSFRCSVLCILNNVNMNQLCRISLSNHSLPEWGILRLGGQ